MAGAEDSPLSPRHTHLRPCTETDERMDLRCFRLVQRTTNELLELFRQAECSIRRPCVALETARQVCLRVHGSGSERCLVTGDILADPVCVDAHEPCLFVTAASLSIRRFRLSSLLLLDRLGDSNTIKNVTASQSVNGSHPSGFMAL